MLHISVCMRACVCAYGRCGCICWCGGVVCGVCVCVVCGVVCGVCVWCVCVVCGVVCGVRACMHACVSLKTRNHITKTFTRSLKW